MIPARLALVLVLVLAAGAAAEPASLTEFLRQAASIDDWLISTRRTLHAYPELMFQEQNTSATIRRTLDELGIPYKCALLQAAPKLATRGNYPPPGPMSRPAVLCRHPAAAAAPANPNQRCCLCLFASLAVQCLLVLTPRPNRFPVARTGLVATLGSGEPVVALRADMDALPILEEGDAPFASTKPGIMWVLARGGAGGAGLGVDAGNGRHFPVLLQAVVAQRRSRSLHHH